MNEKTHQLLIPADSGNYGRITVDKSNKEHIALEFDNIDMIFILRTSMHGKLVGICSFKVSLIQYVINSRNKLI